MTVFDQIISCTCPSDMKNGSPSVVLVRWKKMASGIEEGGILLHVATEAVQCLPGTYNNL